MSESETRSTATEVSNPSFRARLKAETARKVIETVYALVEECRIHLGEDGIHIMAADPALVASVTLNVDSAAFDTYSASGGLIGVNLERLSDVLGVAERDQLVTFTLDNETRKLHVAVDELEYRMALIDPDSIRSPPDPSNFDFEYSGTVVVRTEEVDRFVWASDMVADHLAIGMAEEEKPFYVEAEGDTDDVSLALSDDDLIERTPGSARSLFSLDYLSAINRPIPSDSAVRLSLGNELPIELQYEIASGHGSVEYVLSPRIASS
jgi:proliferating cell nuclear antigen